MIDENDGVVVPASEHSQTEAAPEAAPAERPEPEFDPNAPENQCGIGV